MLKSPARVFVLLPTASDNAIIIRRGPAQVVAVYGWNVKTDEIVLSQWLQGRIYEYQSDISPDGLFFIYSANKKGWGYTVISRAPWIKAISYWRNVGGWGGGVFMNNREYVLYDGYDGYANFISAELGAVKVDRAIWQYGLYHVRLLKRGWFLKSYDQYETIYRKPIDLERSIEKAFCRKFTKLKGKGAFWESHRLITPSAIVDKPDWEWCDYRDGQLLWSERGSLYRAAWDAVESPTLIRDFNPDRFEERRAPY